VQRFRILTETRFIQGSRGNGPAKLCILGPCEAGEESQGGGVGFGLESGGCQEEGTLSGAAKGGGSSVWRVSD